MLENTNENPETIGWRIYNMLKDNVDKLSSEEVRSKLKEYIKLDNPRPSRLHSTMLFFATNYSKKDLENNQKQFNFFNFLKMWIKGNFQDEDWKENKKDGKTYDPLAVKAIRQANKYLDATNCTNIDEKSWMNAVYEHAIEKCPNKWLIRDYAKILIKLGRREEAISLYKKLIIKLGDKYYIWQEMAACVEDVNTKIALLCKAISLEKNEDFIGNVRLDLAEQLIKTGKKNHAAYELDLYEKHRSQKCSQKGWHFSPRYQSLRNQCGEISEKLNSNSDLYNEYIAIAEKLAYAHIPFSFGRISYINENKKVYHIETSNSEQTFIKFKKQAFQIGDFIRFRKLENKMLGIEKCNYADILANFKVKKIEGELHLKAGANFGFVQGCYVSKVMLDKYKITSSCLVCGTAIFSKDKNGKEGWSVFELEV